MIEELNRDLDKMQMLIISGRSIDAAILWLKLRKSIEQFKYNLSLGREHNVLVYLIPLIDRYLMDGIVRDGILRIWFISSILVSLLTVFISPIAAIFMLLLLPMIGLILTWPHADKSKIKYITLKNETIHLHREPGIRDDLDQYVSRKIKGSKFNFINIPIKDHDSINVLKEVINLYDDLNTENILGADDDKYFEATDPVQERDTAAPNPRRRSV